MRVLVLGADGYLGWPTTMRLAASGYDVVAVDNYSRRNIARETCSEALFENPNLNDRAKIFKAATGYNVEVHIGDCCDFRFMERVFSKPPDAVIHYAEQPAAPYGMTDYDQASYTLNNNLNATFNTIWAIMKFAPNCHLIKLGTMGEYGTPNIDIEEGWIEIEHKGRKDKFLYPRAAGSLYHTTKVLDTDLIWFYCRTFGIRVTDLMQGPVYGLSTSEADLDPRLAPNFHYDDIFGTITNRFLIQALVDIPLTVFGKGDQTRGHLNLIDTIQCIELAIKNPANKGQLKIMNQFVELYSANQIAELVQAAGNALNINVKVAHIDNPRKEKESHYYNPTLKALPELGLRPHPMSVEILVDIMRQLIPYKSKIDKSKILPRVKWA